MKLLMTGSSGPKVGSVVAGELAAIHQLAGIDLAPAPHTSLLADITLVADWSPHLEGVDAVIHFAALHAPHRDTHSRDDFQRTNVEATARLLVAAKKAGVKRFLLASTTSVYGRAMRGTTSAAWVTEQLTPQPEDVYDDTKLAAVPGGLFTGLRHRRAAVFTFVSGAAAVDGAVSPLSWC
jgi:nucleoside-diphosphate-sugar epimerase